MAEGSAIGRKLSELTTMRVIMIVLLIVLVLPYLDDVQADEPVSVALQRIESETDDTSRQVYIDSLVNTDRISLLYLRIGDQIYINRPLNSYRPSEIDHTQESISEAIQDIQYRVRAQAAANLEMMACTVLILGIGALLFSRDAFVLVISPIERMVQFVRKLATNPLDVVDMSASPDEKQLRLETELLESTLIKLGCLLQIGFGTAGASIIAKNFKDHGRILNPMLPGSRVNAVFAFCDIRRFTDATECLQESVMVFVNEIADIVHGCCHRLGGAANKNIGDAFFIVWKLGDDEEAIRHPKSDGAKFIADQAIIAFVHCIVELLTSPLMQRWREDKRIVERMPDYNINLGVGIHWGWAIEGAIGTEQKIDASYLSPHVEMSQTLEEMTKVYGVPLIFSGEVFDILSPQLQSMCRLLDAVALEGSQTPLRVYTFDIGGEALEIQKKTPSMPSSLNRGSISLKEAPASIIKRMSIITSPTLSESSPDPEPPADDVTDDYVLIDFASQVKPYRVGIDPRWVDMYNKAVNLYISGNWPMAKTMLEGCRTMVRDDPPTKFLLQFMEQSGPNSPPDWPGYRIPKDSH